MTLMLTACRDANLIYQVASSFGNGPIPIDTRVLGLSFDWLFWASIWVPDPKIFQNYIGRLDSKGIANNVSIAIPANPQLIGVNIYSAFVTLHLSAPSGIKSISNTFSFTITK